MDLADDRKVHERDFHNSVYADPGGSGRARRLFYSVATSVERQYTDSLLAISPRRRVLEYGCGLGSRALALARAGARVSGIDISDAAIARAKAAARDLSLSVDFRVMDAESLQYGNEEFDVVCGTGILHHLDLRRALAEIRRVLKPDGLALFVEPLAQNPVLRAFRAVTPRMRTRDEHPLTEADLKLFESAFDSTRMRFYYLTTPLAIFVPVLRLRARSAELLDRLDRRIFERLPRLRLWAWQVLMQLQAPENHN